MLFTILLSTFHIGSSNGALLTEYDFEAGSLLPSFELYPGSASSVTLGADWVFNGTNDGVVADAINTGTAVSTPDHFLTYTYTVTGLNANEVLNLTSSEIDHTGASNTYRFNTRINNSNIGGNNNPPNSGTYVGNLTGVAAANGLVNGDTVTISFTFRDNTNTGLLTGDNFRLFGEVVPEPSNFLPICFLLLIFVCHRRRRLALCN